MPVPTEVDDLERQIVRFEEEIRRRKGRIEHLKKELQDASKFVSSCKDNRDLCQKNLIKIKRNRMVDLRDYREMLKLYHDNCDLLIQHQVTVISRVNEIKALTDEQIPFLEASLKDAQKRLKQWGQVIPFVR
jgi:chromosome segregation ATPase